MTPVEAGRRPSDGEALVFLSPDDVAALTRGVAACVEAANLPVDDPGAYGTAEVTLRGILQVAQRRLCDGLDREPWHYLDPGAWPEGQEAPAFVRASEVEALERAAAACRAVGAARGGELGERMDGARGRLLALHRAAEGQLSGGEAVP